MEILLGILMGILWILLFLTILLLLFLFIPIKYSVEGNIGTHNYITARISGFFRLVGVFFAYTDSETAFLIKIGPYKLDPSSAKFKKKEQPAKKEPHLNISNVQYLLTKLDIKSIITLGIMLLKKISKKIRPKYLNIRGVVGLKDPCATGQFIGIYEAVVASVGLSESIDLRGDFDKESLKLDGKLAGRFSIASLIGPVIWFALKKPVREGITILKSERAIT